MQISFSAVLEIVRLVGHFVFERFHFSDPYNLGPTPSTSVKSYLFISGTVRLLIASAPLRVAHVCVCSMLHDPYKRENGNILQPPPPPAGHLQRNKNKEVRRQFALFLCFTLFSRARWSFAVYRCSCDLFLSSRPRSTDWQNRTPILLSTVYF